MLETSEERIKMLKTGFTQKQIEQMYIKCNDLRIVSLPIFVDIVEIEGGQNKNACKKAENEYAQSLSFPGEYLQCSTIRKLISHNTVMNAKA